jgi:hypothetical protein
MITKAMAVLALAMAALSFVGWLSGIDNYSQALDTLIGAPAVHEEKL